MKLSITKFLASCAFLLICCSQLFAQLTGTKNIPGDYATLDLAIQDLNTQGVGTGGVILNVISGNAQTAPAGGFLITASGTALDQIVITGNSNTVTASASQTVGSVFDAIFKIVGGDYITVQGFNMLEDAANVNTTLASNTMTEFGVALFYASATNGAQNNTIQNNTISLNGSYQNSIAIFSTTANSAVSVTAASATANSGLNSGLKVYGNTISNVAFGVYTISPPNTATITETGIDIGGSSSATGNTITYGCNTAANGGWALFSTSSAGINTRNTASLNIRYNSVTSIGTLTVASTAISVSASTTPAGLTYTNTVSNNNVTVTNTGTTAITAIDFGYGISTGSIAGSDNTIIINQNASAASSAAVTGIKANYTSATKTVNNNNITINQSASGAISSTTIAITVAGGGTSMSANTNNIIFNQTTSIASGIATPITGIVATSAASVALDLLNNTISVQQAVTGAGTYGSGAIAYLSINAAHNVVNITGNTFNTPTSTIRSTGALDVILDGSSTKTGLLTIKNNTATIDRIAASGNVGFYTQTSTSPNDPADSISSNIITFTNFATSGTVTVINRIGGSASAFKNICNNTITVSGTNTGAVVGIAASYSNSSTVNSLRISGNAITINCAAASISGITLANGAANGVITLNSLSLTSSSTSPSSMIGITGGSSTGPHQISANIFNAMNFTGVITTTPTVSGIVLSTAANNNIFGNEITNISVGAPGSTASATIDGILISGGTSAFVFKNKIHGLTTNAAGTATVVNGIRVSAGTTTSVFNNLIGNLTAPAAASVDALRGVSITSTTATSTINVVYNTIYLAGTSTGANFGTSGIFHTTSATGTTAKLVLGDNIIVNNSVPAGTGLTVAYRRSGTSLANYDPVSNNNLFYAGTPGASNLIMYDGTTSYQSLTSFATAVSPREQLSVTQNPTFLSTTGSSAGFLHLDPSVPSQAESGAANITGITDDYDGDIRQGNTGYAGSGYGPDMGADEFGGTSVNPFLCNGNPVTGTATGWTPVTVTGFTEDVIANGIGLPTTSTTSGADAVPNYFVDATYQLTAGSAFPSFALPASGLIRSLITPGLAFQLHSAIGSNSLKLSAAAATGTLTLSPPQAAHAIALLATTGNGPGVVDVTVTFTDATTQVFTNNTVPDWFNATPFTAQGIGRLDAAGAQNGTSVNPRLYEIKLNLDASNYAKQIASITVTKPLAAGIVHVMAVSLSSATPLASCANSSYQLTAFGAATGPGISYQWKQSSVTGGPYTNVTGGTGATTTMYTTPALTATTYYVLAVTCSASGITTLTNEVPVIVNPAPNVSVTPGTSVFCTPSGTPITLSASGASTYTWSPATGLTLSSTSSPSANPTTTTAYTVTGTDANGCSASAIATVNVGSSITVSGVSASPSTICEGSSSTLTATASMPSTPSTYSFAGSSGTYTPISGTVLGSSAIGDDVGIGNLPIGFTFNYNGVGQTVFAASSNGLILLGNTSGTISGLSSNALASNANAIAPLWDDNNTTGGSIQYLTTGSPGSKILTVQWTNLHVGGSGSSSQPTISMQLRLYEATGAVEFVYGSASAAFASTTASIGISGASGNYLSVTPLSPSNTSTVSSSIENNGISSATNIPSGTTFTFTPVQINYAWSPATFLTSSTTNPTTASSATATTTYTVTVTSSVGCTATGNATLTVTPAVNITTQPIATTTVCINNTLNLSVVATNATAYQWYRGTTQLVNGSNISGATSANLVITNATLSDAGSYTVVVSGTAPCADVTSNASVVTINPLTPTAQPAAPVLTAISGSQINGSFTAAAGPPTGYLVVRYPSGAIETPPVDGVTYTANQSLGLGTVIQVSSATTFISTGLYGGTTYDYYVYSYNSGTCAGPAYLVTGGFIGSQTTTGCASAMSGVVPIGSGLPNTPAGGYTSITDALTYINTNGVNGPTILELQPSYTSAYAATNETYPLAFNANACISPANTLTIRPEATVASAIVLTSANATTTVNLNGARHIVFDGRPGGTGTTSMLTIQNTNVGSSSAILFTGDASYDTVKYCTVLSVENSATNGTIAFTTGTVTGNDFNVIDNCTIADGATTPVNGIYSSGTSAAIDNSENKITNCSIANFFSATLATRGILLAATGNSAWTITGNKLYQSSTRIYTTANTHNGIAVLTGSGYTISNNTIGFSNAAGTGTTNIVGNSVALTGTFPGSYTTTGTANATRYIGINGAFTAGGTVSNIQGNTIGGFAMFSSSGANTANGLWCGINVTSGNANIGTTTGNTIGAASGQSSVYTATTTTGGTAVGIYVTSANTVSIQNNTIGAIDAVGTTTSLSGGVTGIDVAGAGNYTIAANNIGNPTAANIRTGYSATSGSLSNTGTLASTTGGTSATIGIRSTATGNSVAINNNILRGWTTSGTTITVTGITSSGTMTGTTPSAVVNGNSLGTPTLDWMTYIVANSGALAGISLTNTIATTHSIQNNDFRGIVHSVAGSNAHTYITLTGATAANNIATIANNTFTNLLVNTTGSVTFIGHSYTVAATGTQTISNNSIVIGFNKTGAGGTITLASSSASSTSGATISHTLNNFSNITVTGATSIAGWASTDGGTANKSYTNNTFTNWTAGTSAVTGMSVSFGGGAGGNGNVISGNTISNISCSCTLVGLNLGSSGTTHTAFNNTITGLSSNGNVTGIATGAPTGNVNNNNVNTLSSSGASSTVIGISVTAGTNNVNNNDINGLSGSGATSPLVRGISVSGATTANIYKNKIYNLSESAAIATTGGAVNGLLVSGGTTVNAYNNLIGNLTAPLANLPDAIRGINITSTTAATAINVYYNTVYLNATSTGTNFGTSGIYHTSSTASGTAKLDLRNNIVVNTSTAAGTGLTVAYRRSGTDLANYASTSNNNLFYAGTPGAANLIFNDGTTSYQTIAAYKTALVTKDQASISQSPTFLSTTGTSVDFLHIDPAVATQIEGNAAPIAGISDDYDGNTRNASTPDIGADEFTGSNPAPVITSILYVPATAQCNATARTITVNVTSPTPLTTVTLTYNNGTAGSTAMTLTSGTNTNGTWSGTIPAASPANFQVTWSVSADNGTNVASTGGTSYKDAYLNTVTTTATVSATPICAGTSTTLTAIAIDGATGAAAIGTQSTTESTNHPYRSGLGASSRHQFLYLASELTAAGLAAGNLTSIGFTVTSVGTGTLANYTVKLKNSSSTALTTTFETGTFTTVISGLTVIAASGLNTYAFTTPYYWDGTSNILVEICYDNTVVGGSSTVAATTPPAIMNVGSLGVAGACTAATGSTGANRPLTTFGGVIGANYTAGMSWVWTPGNLTGSTINVTPGATTTYTATGTDANGCTVTSNGALVTVIPVPTAPSATNSTQCGIGTPAAAVASTSGANGSGTFLWYSASAGGTLLQGPALAGTLSNYYSNNFSSSTLSNASLSGTAAIGSGALTLQPAVANQQGGFTVNASGVNSTMFQTDFDLSVTATGTTIADGFSYSFGNDAAATTTSPTAEHGSGSKLRIGFFTYNAASAADGKGIYLMYNVSATTGYTASTTGVLAYSTDISWIPATATTVTSHITATINSAGQLTLSVGAVPIFTNVQLPAAFLNADKSSWKHVFSSRSGGVAGGFAMDNLAIQANAVVPGYTTYQAPVSATTTFYVSETGVGGCESGRTPVTVNVTSPDAVTAGTTTSPVCENSAVSLTATQSGTTNTYAYTWTASPSAGSGIPTGSVTGAAVSVTPTAPGTYVYSVAANDATLGCNTNSTISVTVRPQPSSLVASSSLSTICAGGTVDLTASSGATSVPTVLLNENFNALTNNWTATNNTTGGTTPAVAAWTLRPSPYTTTSGWAETLSSPAASQFYLTNSDGAGSNNATNTILQSPAINTVGMKTLSLDFFHYFKYYTTADSIKVEASTNGTTWTLIQDLAQMTPAMVQNQQIGTPANFAAANLSLNSYINTPTLYIRFRYRAVWGYGWAIDSVRVSGTPSDVYTWSSVPAGYSASGASQTGVAPTANTTYIVNATNSYGCSDTAQAAVAVNNPAVITTQPAATLSVCASNAIELNVAATNATGYQWYKGSTQLTNSATTAGATSASLQISNSTTADAGTYSVVVNSAPGCNDVTSNNSVVSVSNMSSTLAANGSSSSYTHSDGLTNTYATSSCEPILQIQDASGGNTLGSVTATVTVTGTVQNAPNGQKYLQRSYTVTPASNGPATVTLYALQSEFTAYNAAPGSYPSMPAAGSNSDPNIPNIRVTKYTGSPFVGAGNATLITPTSVNWNATDNWWEITFPVASFSSFYIHTGTVGPLDIELLRISAVNVGSRNRVDWTTATERNADKFEVERSLDGVNFSYIGTVKANGNPSTYSFWDEIPANGLNHYRLKMIDKAGEYNYSRTVDAFVKSNGAFVVEAYPNPVSSLLTVRMEGTLGNNANILLTDVAGKIIRKLAVTENELKIDMNGLAQGVYFIKYTDDVNSKTIKVNKQ